MNLFLPYDDYKASVECLDRQRLGKQRAEVKAIWMMLENPRFVSQPIVRMWLPNRWWLLEYGLLSCDEWILRGYEDNMTQWLMDVQKYVPTSPKPIWPESYHSSVRANLLRKDPDFYGKYGWKELPVEGYSWPI